MNAMYYITQHELYIRRLKRAIQNKTPFAHKECCKDIKTNYCTFGEIFYTEIMPNGLAQG